MAPLIALGALVFAAVGVVVPLKDALNTVWRWKNPRKVVSGIFYGPMFFLSLPLSSLVSCCSFRSCSQRAWRL
jgi:uncharacterized BrkB/YihY/UPF0761 family membrane protein